ncbi:hypothetical protein SALBM311S_00676 [Streptomyces alboniger]
MIATLLGAVTIGLSFVWKKAPGPAQKIPAALAAVGIGNGVAALPGIDVKTLQVGNLLASVQAPGAEQFAGLADTAIITSDPHLHGDRLRGEPVHGGRGGPDAQRPAHSLQHRAHRPGRRKHVSRASWARSPSRPWSPAAPPTSRRARRPRLSRTLHGLWLLAFAMLLPQVLALIPIPALAGVLVHSGWKLFGSGGDPEDVAPGTAASSR